MTLPVVFTANGQAGYNLTKSLRFRSSANAYLNRTPASAGNRKTWTWSGWVKRGVLSSSDSTLFNAGTTGIGTNDTGFFGIRFTSGNELNVTTGATNLRNTTQVFRDPSAWYHFVVAVDTTQATSSNRIKVYVNGTQVTAFSTSNDPSLNLDTAVNNTNVHEIARTSWSGTTYFDGYMTEVYLIDGQALTPSSFGETSTSTGVWIPKKYSGTYGTNGFYLPFTDTASTSTLGTDFSGNSNTWTVNNISLTAGSTYDSMNDVPTLTSATTANYCVFNGASVGTDATLSNGNLNISYGSSGTRNATMGTIGMSSGKWYAEFSFTSGSFPMFGITSRASSNDIPSYPGSNAFGWGYFVDGDKYTNNTNTAYGATWTTNDVIGVAFDADVGSLTFYKNGTSQGVAFTGLTSGTYFFAVGDGGGAATWSGWANFGQRPFAYTLPTGFVALNTFNLPTPTIGATASTQANDYFNVVTYTGTGSSQSITGVGFQPDWTWIKGRSGATYHGLYDAVRGVQKQLESNTTTAETTETTGLTAFGSDGFTVGALAQLNTSSATYVGWNWKANGAGSTNTAGSITSTVSANTTAGFSVVTMTYSSVAGTVGHGLGVAPKMIIVKRRDSAGSWYVAHSGLTNMSGYYLSLESTAAQGAASWGGSPTSTVFYMSNSIFASGNYVAYCFSAVAGYSAFGSYVGNGVADGPFIYTGFRPRYFILKNITSAQSWSVQDTSRSPYNVASAVLLPNSSSAELTGTDFIDIVSNGFKIRHSSSGNNNNSGDTYIYMAFCESPFKYANAR